MECLSDISGIILLNKPVGISSNKALQKVKRIFSIKKAGHTGSLDPMASGMLPICCGEATKFSQFLLNAEKKYLAKIKLGENSTTGDTEGIKTKIFNLTSSLDHNLIKNVLNNFIGKIEQKPPMYSAIKYNGQPLYKLARQGIDIPRASRCVEIYSINILKYSMDILEIDVHCSKGTYIRTLAEDIGQYLGTGAYLSELHRTEVGHFKDNMYLLHELENMSNMMSQNYILPIENALYGINSVEIDNVALKKIIFGQTVVIKNSTPEKIVKIMNCNYGFIGIGVVLEKGILSPKRLRKFDPVNL